jgi:hypothetical protein
LRREVKSVNFFYHEKGRNPMAQMDKRQKFATQVDAELLSQIKSLAKSEGFQIQAVVEYAFRLFLESKNGEKPRDHVMRAYRQSHGKYALLYKKLAE